ncbi:CoA-transferase family III domain-containing protein [Parachaetomium inaequale]|uniref:CoA-transferase family III domain-containing protein n=1 Tax=Parachaetomium inaequale TaxID=2588326 RepID=A0AAN6SU61_9PEZI|nr:CoA-transferase family III domain-containing protein [Parachaetomium inaequale]
MQSTATMTSAASSMGWAWNGAVDKQGARVSQQSIMLSAFRCWQRLMTSKKDREPAANGSQTRTQQHSVAAGAREALQSLCTTSLGELPGAILAFTETVEVTSTSEKGDEVYFPTPLREQEATAAIKALEACAAAAIAKLRYGTESKKIRVDADKVSAFLMSAYLTTLDGMGKPDPRVKDRIPDTDLNRAQSVLYRRMSANLYRTKNPDEYFHIHGSLDADVTLEMLGLPKDKPEMTDYHAIIDYIGSAVQQHTAAELDALNVAHRQAGIQALTWPQFQATPHGKALLSLPPLTVRPNPADTRTTPPTPFPGSSGGEGRGPQHALAGIKVLELCRIIAGPTIGRSLAAHGAHVLKVTSPNLPDVPFFQLDVNTGKHAIHLDLRRSCPADRATFSALLADADVLIDGYRPGALSRLGYGPEFLGKLARARGKGFVYVAEDCFGGTDLLSSPKAEWASRPGWQQIADCVTGVAWAQGAFMGLDEPVVPPFPMSDYGTGALGSAAALAGLYRRATEGGSWVCRTSLVQYDVFLMGLGLLPPHERERLRRVHENEAGFFGLRHSDSVDEVGRRALASMRVVVPHLFAEDGGVIMQEAWSEAFKGVVRWPREAVEIEGLRVGHVRTARPNGWDKEVGWEGWEEEIGGEVAAGEVEKLAL